MGQPPGQVANEGLLAVAAYEAHRQVRLQSLLVIGVWKRGDGFGQQPAAVIKTPMFVIDMAAVEAFERRESSVSSAGRNEAGFVRAVQVPFAPIVRGVACLVEQLRPADLAEGQLEVVPDHACLVGIAPGHNTGAVRRADGVGRIGSAPIGALSHKAVEVGRRHDSVRAEPESARPPPVGQNEQQIR